LIPLFSTAAMNRSIHLLYTQMKEEEALATMLLVEKSPCCFWIFLGAGRPVSDMFHLVHASHDSTLAHSRIASGCDARITRAIASMPRSGHPPRRGGRGWPFVTVSPSIPG
jgi:hypothetical protein